MRTAPPIDERPRERLARSSARGLSLRELLALVLSSGPPGKGCLGLAADVLSAVGDEERGLFLALESDLFLHAKVPGLGVALRSRLLAALELGRRYAVAREHDRIANDVPLDTAAIERRAVARVDAELRTDTHEWLGFVPILRSRAVGQLVVVARGTRISVAVDPQELFLRILAVRPAAIVLVHNHPSGDTQPSSQDHELTRSVAQLAASFGIVLLGHWIVGPGRSRRI